jgi:hypothetical protein
MELAPSREGRTGRGKIGPEADPGKKRTMRRPLFGWFLLLTGFVWLLVESHLLPADVSRWWPLAVVLLALIGVVRAGVDRRRQALGAYVAAFILSVFWLARENGSLNDDLFGPTLLIALGLGLIVRRLVPDGR